MKILINTSTIVQTGCTQVAVSFIEECKKHKENEYFVLLSKNVRNNLKIETFPLNFTFYYISKHPLYGIRAFNERRKLCKLERSISPDCTFSVFGPSWWTPHSPHLQGFAFGYYVNQESPYFRLISLKEKIKIKIMKTIHMYYYKKNGQYFVCETKFVSHRLANLLGVPFANVYTVSNTVNSYFLKYKQSAFIDKKDRKEVFSLYSLCAPQKHKNLSILNKVIPCLRRILPEIKIQFHVTCPEDKYEKIFNKEIQSDVINHGLLNISQCPEFVDSYDALFLPTLVECFSASYPEAMLMGKPILTSDLPFAKSICGNAAIYFNPLDAEDISKKIILICCNRELYTQFSERGKERYKSFPSASYRAERYLNICKKISEDINLFQ